MLLIEQLTEYYAHIYRNTLVIVGITVLVYCQGMLCSRTSYTKIRQELKCLLQIQHSMKNQGSLKNLPLLPFCNPKPNLKSNPNGSLFRDSLLSANYKMMKNWV